MYSIFILFDRQKASANSINAISKLKFQLKNESEYRVSEVFFNAYFVLKLLDKKMKCNEDI